MDLNKKSNIREIKNKHDFRFTKSLGQNFLADRNVTEMIIGESDIGEKDLVIEIGPGMGTLTAMAAERARKVVAIEIDSELIPVLADTLREYENVGIINNDVLKTDLKQLIAEEKKTDPEIEDVRILGNLPYYITTPIIMKILREDVPAASITIMMQKEVADRIRSGPGSKTYGALSATVQYYCEVEKVCDASAECFIPRPKVDSEVLKLTIRPEKAVSVIDEDLFFACIRAGFSQRRKTLGNCMKQVIGPDRQKVNHLLEEAGIDPARRAETLSLDEFARIADCVRESI